jgi:hypothetical protein
MRTDHFAHLLTGLSPVVPGPSPVTGDTEMQGGTRLSPVSPVVPGKKHNDPEQPSIQQIRAGLREALAMACEGLPLTLAELTEAFGEEGESDWRHGYEPHCNDDYLRAFALAVAERLEREPIEPATANPLGDLPLLPDDRAFIRKRTRYQDDEEELIAGYRQQWIRAAAAEPLSVRQANAGRRAANLWLLEKTER